MREVRVKWVDPHTRLGWVKQSDLAGEKSHVIQSLGFLVLETPELIGISSSWGQNGDDVDVAEVMIIPRACILEMSDG